MDQEQKIKISSARKIPKEVLMQDLLEVAEKLGKKNISLKDYNNNGKYSGDSISRSYGTWNAALTLAGLEVNTIPQKIPSENLLNDVIRVANELGKTDLTFVEYSTLGKYKLITFKKRFGGWIRVLENAGLKEKKLLKPITEQEFIDDLIAVTQKLDKDFITFNEYRKNGKYPAKKLIKFFGSWNKALINAKLLAPYQRNIVHEDLIEDLKRVALKLGKNNLTAEEYKEKGEYGSNTIARHLGSWNKAVALAGLDVNVNKKEIIFEAKHIALSLQKVEITFQEFKEKSQYSLNNILKSFGSWEKFLLAAGLKIDIVDEEILNDLKRVLKELGTETMSFIEYKSIGKYTYPTFIKKFESWNNALMMNEIPITKKLKISNIELIADLKRVSTLLGKDFISPKDYKEHGKFTSITISKHFGTWKKALVSAGLKIVKEVDKEAILEDLKNAALEFGGNEIAKKDYKLKGGYNINIISKNFGSWEEAVAQAGLTDRDANMNMFTDDELLDNLEKVWLKLKKTPVLANMKPPLSKYNGYTYIKKYSSWHHTLLAFYNYIILRESSNEQRLTSYADSITNRITKLNFDWKFRRIIDKLKRKK